MPESRDPSLDRLLDLDGEVLFVTENGDYWVNFQVRRVQVTASRPHGLKYSLTLHGRGNERIVGFDNAHPSPDTSWERPHDHNHVRKSVKPYEYADAIGLLEDF